MSNPSASFKVYGIIVLIGIGVASFAAWKWRNIVDDRYESLESFVVLVNCHVFCLVEGVKFQFCLGCSLDRFLGSGLDGVHEATDNVQQGNAVALSG